MTVQSEQVELSHEEARLAVRLSKAFRPATTETEVALWHRCREIAGELQDATLMRQIVDAAEKTASTYGPVRRWGVLPGVDEVGWAER